MKKTLITLGFCAGLIGAVEAAPSDVVTQADLQALKALIEQQNAKIEAQAKRIAELEGKTGVVATTASEAGARVITPGEGTETNETGRIWTMGDGRKFYLADATAGIFNPLTESGLQFEPYGYLVLEAVHNTHGTLHRHTQSYDTGNILRTGSAASLLRSAVYKRTNLHTFTDI